MNCYEVKVGVPLHKKNFNNGGTAIMDMELHPCEASTVFLAAECMEAAGKLVPNALEIKRVGVFFVGKEATDA